MGFVLNSYLTLKTRRIKSVVAVRYFRKTYVLYYAFELGLPEV